MADPLRHPPAPAEPAWVQLCRWLWAQQKYVWSVLIMGIIVGVIGNWLTSSTSIFTGTALGTILLWIRDHLLLVILVGIGNYFADRSTHSSSVSDLQQDRPNLIRLLRNEYQRQMSESLQRSAMMGLALQPRTDILLSPALLTSWHMDMPGEASLPTPVSIVQAYDAAGRGLLILGAPGTGKSTLLRELAFELLKRADEDATQPVPVMVNLSSWAVKKPSLTVWMPEQLWDKYRIPPRLSQSLIKENRLLFLLDGLNEVEPSARTKCVEAIEAYLAEQGRLIPIVVCSRSHAYLEQGKRLGLFTVEVQPLTSEQINGYLKEVGRPMSAVRSALGSNPVLRELITTPLMLKVVMLAYRGKTAKNPPQLGSKEEQQRQVVEHYVERMLSGQGNKRSFTSQQTRLWLTWLAQQMQLQHVTEFYLERLHPNCLPTKQVQRFYFMLTTWPLLLLIGWLAFGLLILSSGLTPSTWVLWLIGGTSPHALLGSRLVSEWTRRRTTTRGSSTIVETSLEKTNGLARRHRIERNTTSEGDRLVVETVLENIG